MPSQMTTILTILPGALAGGLVSFWINTFQEWARVRRISRKLRLEPQPRVGSRVTARVVNDSNCLIRGAVAYLTIQHELADVIAPPKHFAAFVVPDRHLKKLEEDKLCWSAVAPTRNPALIDIYAGERQLLDVADFGASDHWIEIPSEVGYSSSQTEGESKTKGQISSRVFLKAGRPYLGTIKIVSADTRAKIFEVEIDLADARHPLKPI